MDARKAKKLLLAIEMSRDELALRIAQPCLGMIAADYLDATEELNKMDQITGSVVPMGNSFRRAADAAMAYFHECVNKSVQS